MTDYVVARNEVGVHAKRLSPNEIDTVTFMGAYLPEVEILSDGISDIYVTFGADSVPEIESQRCWRVPAYPGSSTLPSRLYARGGSLIYPTTVVKMISEGACGYSVSRSR